MKMDWMLQSKDIGQLYGDKNETLTYAAYKRLTSGQKTVTQTECKQMENDIPCRWKWKKKKLG